MYKWFTISYFIITSVIILMSIIFISLHISEEQGFEILAYLLHSLAILQIFADIYLKRGPFHLNEGKFNIEYSDNSKNILDLSRLISAIILIFSY